MEFYTSYSEEELKEAAEKRLQIVSDYLTNLDEHLDNIKETLLIGNDTLLSIIAAINAGFNVILYGPPGTAKSTISSLLPLEFYGAKCNIHTADSEWNVRKVIGGITVSYDTSVTPIQEVIWPRDGFIIDDIMECYETRLETKENDTVFSVIDEFNRTNMDECLGPMFTAMGSDNRTIKLEYNKGFIEDFLKVDIPNGYRMICTMNKYDRTFTNELSDALARRFKWIYVGAPDQEDYDNEDDIVFNKVFGVQPSRVVSTPVNLLDIPDYYESNLFNNTVKEKIFDIVNDMRSDLELGTSYKIDSLKIANHYFVLKMSIINWDYYNEVTMDDVIAANDIGDVSALITDPDKKNSFEEEVQNVVYDAIDAALVMTVIPACESLEDMDSIERNKERFSEYSRCSKELERMKLAI